jgi:hypothetical protein
MTNIRIQESEFKIQVVVHGFRLSKLRPTICGFACAVPEFTSISKLFELLTPEF